MQGAFRHDNKRPNLYGAESQENSYLNLIARFAIEFEKTYIHWLYEALEMVEPRQKQAPEDEE
jgi:PadR family transcriptional regulator, regulatory protein AphA